MLNTFLAFLRNPTDHFAPDSSLRTCVRALLVLLVYDLVFAFIAATIIGLISKLGWVDLDNHAVADALNDFSILQLMLVAVLGTPLVEELIFRLPLRFETNHIAGLARIFAPRTSPDIDEELRANRRAGWDGRYRYLFYGFTLAFAFVHLFNYPDWSLGVLLLSPLLVAPQFMMGAMAGFLRVRYGFVWAFLLHALHNLILVGVAVLSVGETEVIDVNTDNYDLMVREVTTLVPKDVYDYVYLPDSIGFTEAPLYDVVTFLVKEDEETRMEQLEDARNPSLTVEMKADTTGVDLKGILLEELKKYYQFQVHPPATDTSAYRIEFVE